MEFIGTVVVYIIMACAVIGAIASVVKPESELGQQFVGGIDAMALSFSPLLALWPLRRI